MRGVGEPLCWCLHLSCYHQSYYGRVALAQKGAYFTNKSVIIQFLVVRPFSKKFKSGQNAPNVQRRHHFKLVSYSPCQNVTKPFKTSNESKTALKQSFLDKLASFCITRCIPLSHTQNPALFICHLGKMLTSGNQRGHQ